MDKIEFMITNTKSGICCAITARYEKIGNNKFSERYYIPKTFVEIAEKIDIELVPVLNKNMLNFVSTYCDALIITGSNIDINPNYYGKSPDNMAYMMPVDEYTLDKDLMQAFVEKPVLGICGGMQALNVFYGGTLHRVEGHYDKEHIVHIINDNVSSIFNSHELVVNSYHGWAVDKLGNNILCGAVSDNITECIISQDGYKLGVQWHPEIMNETDWIKVFDWLQKQVFIKNN